LYISSQLDIKRNNDFRCCQDGAVAQA